MTQTQRYRSSARGFTLIEALVALLVLSFGMLAIAGFQVTLTRNSDLAKQRTEATRLAQQKMESLRSYGQVDTYTLSPHIVNYTDDVVSGPPVGSPDVITTNAAFDRTWTVTANAANTEKWINVQVAWTDRSGQAQRVQLLSVISKFDPRSIGTLATGPGGSNVRRPKNRNLNIPYPAVTLSGGTQSAFIPPPGSVTYVFDNNTGNIVQSCTGLSPAALVEGLDLASSGATCSALEAYLLSGYVRFDTANNPSGAEPSSPANSRHDTKPLDATAPLSLATSNTPTPNLGGSPTMVCYSQRQRVVETSLTTATSITSLSRSGSTVTVNAPGHSFVGGETVAINATTPPKFIGAFVVTSVGAGTFTYTLPPPLPTETSATGGTAVRVARLTIPEGSTVSGYTTLVSRFVSYACIVTPVDHDSVVATPKRWWGSVTLNANADSGAGTVWVIGAASGQFKVCRYSADYNSDGATSNSEHPLWYRGVTGALDSQNFLVIDRSQNCPTDQPANPLGSPARYADNTTAGHQPNSISERSFQCPIGGCGTKAVLEPSTTATDITME